MKENIIGKYRGLFVVLLIALSPCLVWSGPAKPAKSAAPVKQVHPELSKQEQYIDCAQCHAEATPKVHEEWFASRHGLAMVKCYQCHGTFENFRVTPTRQDCAACHENMLKKCPQDKPCWQCHVPHTFKAKK
ncbi:MAG: multiheme C-type cytochrome [Desulfobulbus sp.]|uniref:multiheme C-type cytochrome n=1 Tax=Desulfobulbus sp. TaxID=895 RepID=UPI00283EC97A|nr:multiheme C-type cytochrome [Desulfobulbus sp.]MDR2549911.1 multiheme C-type cytochrome [Desulfobulbus sp.]